MPKQKDRELVERIESGDAKAESDLVSRYGKRIDFDLRNRIGWHNEEVKDVAQETIIAVLMSLREGKFDPQKGTLSSYIAGFSNIKYREYIREKNKATKNKVDLERVADCVVDENVDLIADSERDEQRKILKTIFKWLKKEYQEILYLKYYRGLSVQEISEKLAMPQQKVSNRLFQAKDRIQKEYHRYMRLTKQ